MNRDTVNNNRGRLFWITGLSGAGKTTVSGLLYHYLKEKENNIVLIDGDDIRSVYDNRDYSEEGREKVTYINMRLCKMLTDQGIDVITAFIGMKEEYRIWNRMNIQKYYEIYLRVPIDELIRRDSKGLYRRALNKEIRNVYGIDMDYEEPQTPDIVIDNHSSTTPELAIMQIVDKFNL